VLDVPISASRIAELADAARFDAMKQHAAELAPNSDIGIFRDLSSFFHAGHSGQWRDLLGPDDLDHYDARLRELAGPDLAAWLRAGSRVP
jgi:hypothetical protein